MLPSAVQFSKTPSRNSQEPHPPTILGHLQIQMLNLSAMLENVELGRVGSVLVLLLVLLPSAIKLSAVKILNPFRPISLWPSITGGDCKSKQLM